MPNPTIPADEFPRRWAQVQTVMADRGLDLWFYTA